MIDITELSLYEAPKALIGLQSLKKSLESANSDLSQTNLELTKSNKSLRTAFILVCVLSAVGLFISIKRSHKYHGKIKNEPGTAL